MSDNNKNTLFLADPLLLEKNENSNNNTTFYKIKDILNNLAKAEQKIATERMAFEVDPQVSSTYSFYQAKTGLVPDYILKRIAGPQGDELVNQIIQARSSIISLFGRPRISRFSIGFDFEPKNINIFNNIDKDIAINLKKQLDLSKELLWNCGVPLANEDPLTLSQFLKIIVRDMLVVGRCAIEFIYTNITTSDIGINIGEKKCVAFRPVDASTIYKILPSESQSEQTRKQALKVLSKIKNREISEEQYLNNKYKYVQVIKGQPVQVFTEDELVVYNLYPCSDVEFNGYPLTPIDQALNAIITHINISLHNKLYFESGRAAKGMLIIRSDDIDEGTIQTFRNHIQQSINSIQNSWRVPVIGIGSNDNIVWQQIDAVGKDQEFYNLSLENVRSILTAFQISPVELSGYMHLDVGTKSQALAESDYEYKILASRDTGLRPLLSEIQDLFNNYIIPKLCPEINKYYNFTFIGLDLTSPEKESVRLAQDMSLHLTLDDILERVGKQKIGQNLGGKFPLNQVWQQSIAPYLSVGQILEGFFGIEGASKDPRFQYYRDPYWIQYQQLLLHKAQLSLQQQALQMQPQFGGINYPQLGQASQEHKDIQKNEDIVFNKYLEQMQNIKTDHSNTNEYIYNAMYEQLNKTLYENSKHIAKIIRQISDKKINEILKDWKEITSGSLKNLLLDLYNYKQ